MNGTGHVIMRNLNGLGQVVMRNQVLSGFFSCSLFTVKRVGESETVETCIMWLSENLLQNAHPGSFFFYLNFTVFCDQCVGGGWRELVCMRVLSTKMSMILVLVSIWYCFP